MPGASHELYRSLTWDRGSEMAGHKRPSLASTSRFTSVTRTIHGSGTTEHERLLRQYLLKGLDLSGYSQKDWMRLRAIRNQRPAEDITWGSAHLLKCLMSVLR